MSDPITLSLPPRLAEILMHSLGLGRSSTPYRNHFCAGGDDVAHCRELVGMGYMTEHGASSLSGGDPVFTVTRDGEVVARREWCDRKPRLTRAQERYQEFLDTDMGMAFGEWLLRRKVSQ